MVALFIALIVLANSPDDRSNMDVMMEICQPLARRRHDMVISSCNHVTWNNEESVFSMTQTMNGQNNDAKQNQAKQPPSQTLRQPGQRQQERLMRQERRRKRQRVTISSIIAIALVIAGVFGIVWYQQYQAAAQTAADKIKSDHTTATANVQSTADVRHATATAQVTATANAQLLTTALAGTPVPKAGPASPPTVSGTPVKLADGLQYIDIKAGTGPEAKAGSTVLVEYTGWTKADGKKFDSSFDRGADPYAVQNIGQASVIAGWNEGLIGVKAGTIRRLIIPAALGYGAQGSPPAIGPNADLIFDVTVLSVTNP